MTMPEARNYMPGGNWGGYGNDGYATAAGIGAAGAGAGAAGIGAYAARGYPNRNSYGDGYDYRSESTSQSGDRDGGVLPALTPAATAKQREAAQERERAQGHSRQQSWGSGGHGGPSYAGGPSGSQPLSPTHERDESDAGAGAYGGMSTRPTSGAFSDGGDGRPGSVYQHTDAGAAPEEIPPK